MPLKLVARSPRRRKTGPDSRHEKDTNIFRSPLRRLEDALGQEQAKRVWRNLDIHLETAMLSTKLIPHTQPSHVERKAETRELC